MKSYKKKSIEKKFNLAHILHENGMENKDIATIVGRKSRTIKSWLKYENYESFQKSLVRGQRSKPKSHDDLSEIMAKLEEIEGMIVDLPAAVRREIS